MIIDLGLTDYEEAYKLQKELVAKRKLGDIGDCLVITEHRAVFTIGRGGRGKDLLISKDVLESAGLKVLNIDRGGDVTFHGPGQLVVYPIIDLKGRDCDMHRYLRDLESAVITFLNGYGIIAERSDGRTGVWVGGRKIASIGVGASNWVAYHGVSVNIDIDLSYFSMIHPCGIIGVKMTSLSDILGFGVCKLKAKNSLASCFKRVFGIKDDIFEEASQGRVQNPDLSRESAIH